MASLFEMELVLEQLRRILESNVNHCDYEYLRVLAEELQDKIELLKQQTCGICEKPCGNDWCVTKDKDVKSK